MNKIYLLVKGWGRRVKFKIVNETDQKSQENKFFSWIWNKNLNSITTTYKSCFDTVNIFEPKCH